MKFIKKNKHAILWSGLGILFLFTRFYNLLLLPIFTDESIYIYWAKVIATTHSQPFISLSDGKPPLLVWMISFFLTIFPSDWYLLAGRLPSVIAGAISLLGIYKLTEILFNAKKPAYIAVFLYILMPYSLFYDRLALFDSLLCAMLLWTCYFAIRTGITKRYKDAVLWGFFLGLAFLSKPTALLFVILTPLIVLLFLPKKTLVKDWKKLLPLILLALAIGLGINNLQRVSSAYPAMQAKNQQFQQPIEKILKNPFELTFGNLKGMFGWIYSYYTWPLLAMGVIGFITLLIKRTRVGIILLFLWFIPLFALATIGREIFARYILFTTPYFLIGVAYFMWYITTLQKGLREFAMGIAFLSILSLFSFDFFLLTDPVKAPLPSNDKHQHISFHSSGYGLSEVFTFLNNEKEKGHITLVTQGTFGLYPYAFNLEYWDNPQIRILPKWPLDTIDEEITAASKESKVYILLKEHEAIPENLPLKLVLKAEKPGGQYPLLLTELKE